MKNFNATGNAIFKDWIELAKKIGKPKSYEEKMYFETKLINSVDKQLFIFAKANKLDMYDLVKYWGKWFDKHKIELEKMMQKYEYK